jgi:hypothetical protein
LLRHDFSSSRLKAKALLKEQLPNPATELDRLYWDQFLAALDGNTCDQNGIATKPSLIALRL